MTPLPRPRCCLPRRCGERDRACPPPPGPAQPTQPAPPSFPLMCPLPRPPFRRSSCRPLRPLSHQLCRPRRRRRRHRPYLSRPLFPPRPLHLLHLRGQQGRVLPPHHTTPTAALPLSTPPLPPLPLSLSLWPLPPRLSHRTVQIEG